MSPARAKAILDAVDSGEIAEEELDYYWPMHARPEQLPPPGQWLTWLVLAGRGFGKAVYLGMKIPTISGWTTMEEIKVGDVLFDENGSACSVTFVSEIQLGRPCFDIEFDDGTVITADADHEWLTWTHAARKAAARRIACNSPRHARPQSTPRTFPEVRRTRDILATLTHGPRGDVNHSVHVAAAIDTPSVALPIGPYTLGAWLGDGDSRGAIITGADPEILTEIRREGYSVGKGRIDPRSHAVRYAIGNAAPRRDSTTGRMLANGSLCSQLKAQGLHQNKHIPPAYLRASRPQREALLCGLMDTDGSVTPGGHCEFTCIRKELADGVMELVLSLGFKAVLGTGRATIGGKDCGPKYRVTFTPHRPVFRLSRKLARQHTGKAQSNRTSHRYIVDVRPVPTVPVRCIQVDSPSHLFLCSESFIPTHNTRTGAEWVRHRVERCGKRRIALVAPTAADARDVMVEGESGLLSVCPPWNRPRYEPSKRRVTWPNGAIATTYSADEPERLRGPQHDDAWLDEVGAWRYAEAHDMLMFGLRLGTDPRLCVTTTPKPSKLVKAIMASPTTVRTGGSTYENRANLAESFFDAVVSVYEGTRLGLQEIHAELTDVADGAWFPGFSMERHVSPAAVYDPRFPAHVAIDCGVSRHTGAVFFHVLPDQDDPYRVMVTVFADYYAEGLYSRANAEAIRDLAAVVAPRGIDRVRLDPASSARTGVGPSAESEYANVFGYLAAPWPLHPVADGLDLIDVMLGSDTKPPEIRIHPDCRHTIEAFKNYRRDFRGGEWLSTPKDPQHPHEELMDSLRGGLMDVFPDGRRIPVLSIGTAGKPYPTLHSRARW